MHVLLILNPVTNLIITFSFVVGFYSPTLFLVFQVSIKGWKGNFSYKSQKVVFKEKKHKWLFFSIFTPNSTVLCVQTNHTHYKEIFPRISLIISKAQGNYHKCGVFWKFCFQSFCPLKKSVHKHFILFKIDFY